MNNNLTYIQYSRKSSESKERQALSIPEQKAECRKIEDGLNLKVTYRLEESRSAYKPNNRPEFDKMISLIESGESNAILTWKPDRLCRNPKEGGYLLQLLQDGVLKEIRCPDGDVYSPDSDHLILQIHFGMANQYSRNLSKNVKRSNSYKFHTSKRWLGPAKPGYLNSLNISKKEKQIIVDEVRFDILQKGMRMILSGSYTPMEILQKINKEWSYRTRKTEKQGGKPLTKSSWYRILADPYYYGLMVRKEGEEFGSHQSMISKDEFQKIQIILGRKGNPRMSKHQFAFKEVLKCGECGGSVTAEERWQIICPRCKTKFHRAKNTIVCKSCGIEIEKMKNPKILHYIHYHCTKKVNPNCTQGSIPLNVLENQIDEQLKAIEIKEQFKDWAIKHLNELNENEVVERHTVRNNTQEALGDTVKRLDNLTRLLYLSTKRRSKSYNGRGIHKPKKTTT